MGIRPDPQGDQSPNPMVKEPGFGGNGPRRIWAAAQFDSRVLTVAALGFASGLPLLLTLSTLTAWLTTQGVSRTSIGLFAFVGLPYSLKFLWAPVIDRVPFPLLSAWLGRRRGWGVGIQILLILAIVALGASDPVINLHRVALLAVVVAFLSASQDIVIDAYRVEILSPDLQGPGAGAVQAGYRIAMLVAGAGALYLAQSFGWFVAYGFMAAGLGVGLAVLLIRPEPIVVSLPQQSSVTDALRLAVIEPFVDFTRHQGWLWMLIFTVIYKLGEAMAGFMANPLYVELGYSLDEIATVSKVFGFAATVAGGILGGILTARLGMWRALLIFGVLQSLGNLAYVLQALSGHNWHILALCVAVENLTSGMAGAALVAWLSSLCNPAFTATQYALLSSLSSVGRTTISSSTGWLVTHLGWVDFYLLTTLVTLPALILLWAKGKPGGRT